MGINGIDQYLQIIFSVGEIAEKFISGAFGDLRRAFGHFQVSEVLQEQTQPVSGGSRHGETKSRSVFEFFQQMVDDQRFQRW